MIHIDSDPQMTKGEVLAFHRNMSRLMRGDLTEVEKKSMSEKRKNMERVTRMVLSKNGGKNPILGY